MTSTSNGVQSRKMQYNLRNTQPAYWWHEITTLYFILPDKKIRDCCPLSYIERNTFLTNAWQKSQDGRPSTYLQAPLSTDGMVTYLNHRITHYTPRCHKIQGSDSVWSTYILNLIRYSKKQKGKDICHTRTWKGEWMTMHSSSCHRTKKRKQKYFLPTPNTQKTKDSTAVSKATLEDPAHPCEWRPKTKSILVGSAQRNVPLSS